MQNFRSHTPIIALTANVGDADRQRCLQAGMDDFAIKPMKHDSLRLLIEHWTAVCQNNRKSGAS